MDVEGIDKLVIATLAGAKAAAEKKELPGHYIFEYEKMLAVFKRRQAAKSLKGDHSPPK